MTISVRQFLRSRVFWISLISVTVATGNSVGWYTRSSDAALPAKPSVELTASASTITLPCAPGLHNRSGSCPGTVNTSVGLRAVAKDFHGTPIYSYTVTGGRITGEGNSVTWDLSGLSPGSYTAAVEVRDNKKHLATSTLTVSITSCPDCVPDLACASITVSCSDRVTAGTEATFTASLSSGSDLTSYNWTISAGKIVSGQGTSEIKVSTNGLAGQTITATVEVSLDPSCGRTQSCSTSVAP